VRDNPRLMAAYDLLARCHEERGEHAQAQKTLEDAVGISPHMVRRLRKLGEVALETGDVAAAEKSFKQVVTRSRYSEFRNPEDHVNLVKALVRKGDQQSAAAWCATSNARCAARRNWTPAWRSRTPCCTKPAATRPARWPTCAAR
jgi:tetratricopeptide (TPR) repeat protein